MTDDIVERLRDRNRKGQEYLRDDAADEIERLRTHAKSMIEVLCADRDACKAEIERLREALESVDSEIMLTGQIKELVDAALEGK